MINKISIIIILFAMLFINDCSRQKVETSDRSRLKIGSAEYLLNEGILNLNAGDYATAEKKFMQALAKKPDLVGALNGMGVIYINKGDFDNAAKNFRRILQMNNKYIEAYNYLGVIFTETGKYELAKENLLIAANSESYKTPENAFANLAFLEIKQKNYESALRYANKGIAKNKNFAPLFNLKGIIYENMNDYPRAVFFYEKALSLLTEDDIGFLINLARTYLKMNNKPKALDILEKALPKAVTPEYKEQINLMMKEVNQ